MRVSSYGQTPTWSGSIRCSIDSGRSAGWTVPGAGARALIPEEAAELDQQWRTVMATATATFDLVEVFAVLESWRRIAWMTDTHGPEAHRAMYR